jgi:glycosyltransferase involved in cell wall biosynthesis
MQPNPESQRLKRILHVPRRFSQEEWGGTEAVVTNLCRAQLGAGWCPEIHTSLALSSTRQEIWRGIPIYRYPYVYPFMGLSAADRLQLDKKGGNLLSWQLYRSLRRQRGVRIYHAHVTKRMGGSVLRAARANGRPCVVTLHGNVFDVPESEAGDVTRAQEGHMEWGKPFGWYFRSRQLLAEADAVLCVGFSEYDKAREVLGHGRVHFLPNGVHRDHFVVSAAARLQARSAIGLPADAFVFGCISRIDPQKNQLVLVDAFSRLAADHPTVHLVLSGPETSSHYAAQVDAAISASSAAQRIHRLPPVAPETREHAGLFAALDAFVLPSRHEPFGIVVLEAWAAGKPVIASRVGGLSRLVTDGVTGWHVEPGDAEALERTMADVLAHPEAVGERVASAQRLIAAEYAWDSVSARLETIYQSLEQKET